MMTLVNVREGPFTQYMCTVKRMHIHGFHLYIRLSSLIVGVQLS